MNEGEPRRVHPATILIGALKSGPSTLLALPAVFAFSSGRGLDGFVAAVGVVAMVMVALAWLRWRRFTYRIGEDELVIESGILHRSRRSIPLERIQDVSIEQQLLARLLGLALVRIETGGGETDEGTLDSVSLAEAHRLRATLRGNAAVAGVPDPGEAVLPAPETVFAMSLGRVLLHGLFSFSLLWLAAIFGLLQMAERIPGFDWDAVAGIARREAEARFSAGSPVAAALTVLTLALLLGVVAGVARTLARDHGFRLTHDDGRFRRVRGLLTRSEVVIADRRIQLALVQRGAISGRLGWNALDFQTLGGSNDPSGRQEAAPFATPAEVARVIAAAGLPEFEREGLRQVSRGHVIRAVVRSGMPLLLVIGIAGLVRPELWLGLLIVPVPVCIALFQRRHHRYAPRDSSFQVTRGVLSQHDWIVPYGAVQGVTIRRSWLQRRLGIASVEVDTAGARGGRGPNVADIAQTDAEALARTLLARA